MKRRVIPCILALSMLVNIVGCSGKTAEETQESTTSVPTSAAETQTAETQTAETQTAEEMKEPAASLPAYTAGTYTAKATGMDGTITIEVTFSDEAITDITVVDDNETAGVGDIALALIADAVLEGQTLAVDTVSGATVSSYAMLSAITDAVTQAGGDTAALKANIPTVEKADAAYDDYDVVVVGSGIAGLAAAMSAVKAGAKVAVLEKLGIVGGTSIFSSGAFLCTGVEEEVDALTTRWLAKSTQNVHEMDPEMVAALTAVSPAVVAMLDATGMEGGIFREIYYKPDATEKAIKNASTIELATAGVTEKGGENLIATLQKELVKSGVDFYMNTPATSLITDANGAVTGVVSDTEKGKLTFNGTVILATGGYAQNEEMTAELCKTAIGNYTAACVGDTGDGIQMALNVGAVTYEFQESMSGVFAPDPYNMPVIGQPSNSYPYECLLVTAEGERAISETAGTHDQMLYFVVDGEADYGWVVMDAEIAQNYLHLDDYLGRTSATSAIQAYKEDSIEALAADMGVDAATLQATIDHYNELCAAGEDTDFGKEAEYLSAIDDGTYYAVKEYNLTRGNYGGIVSNEKSEVVDANGNAIPGLYAAGIISSGAFLGDYYPGGQALAIGAHMGYIAGENAAAYAGK